VQVGVESTNTFLVQVAPGPHDLRVELVTRDHREFTPVVAADTPIRVSGLGAPASWRPCPNQ
jgi:hypothetical protein